ncbi:STELLO glycosyltransferase family protein [Candidatus Pelagibacter sp.]|nr:STELLO glycosyltransferase family protein [Candidatus Pelagibacter sp.]
MFKTSLVITTINKPNRNLKKYALGCKKKNWKFIIIGDKKTPKNFNLKNSFFISFKKTIQGLSFISACPLNSYSRKNIGYLLAMKENSDVIVETDDDNSPLSNFFKPFKLYEKARTVFNNDWLNICNYFINTNKNFDVWPRGLPLDKIKKDVNEKLLKQKRKKTLINHSLCNGNPDVDAIFRLINKNKINVKFLANRKYFISKKSFCPFNSQSTMWYKDSFPLLYLPSYCSMRSTDIFRGLIALVILKNDNQNIIFSSPTVFQKRNVHDLLLDFKDEVPVHLFNKKIIDILKKIKFKKGVDEYLSNLKLCYVELIKNGIFPEKELKLVNLWIKDIKNLPDD